MTSLCGALVDWRVEGSAAGVLAVHGVVLLVSLAMSWVTGSPRGVGEPLRLGRQHAAVYALLGSRAALERCVTLSRVQAVRTLPADDGPLWHHHHGGYWGHDHYYGGGIGLGLGLGLSNGL
ncbi:hypothetical protein K377_07325 [Streptomyces sp. PsTaAH-137]|nr:hypothetical protein K377_07325 [Streptomyces sp. PsTaAH-137]